MAPKLIKTDRNGTKYYEEYQPCWKCGGSGTYYWGASINGSYMYGGVCFACNGSGKTLEKWKEYTPEHRAKLDAQREKRTAKRLRKRDAEWQAEGRAKFLKKEGFNEAGKTYLVLGDTYPIKDAIKRAGGMWRRNDGWFFLNPTEGFETVEMDISDFLEEHERWFDVLPYETRHDNIKKRTAKAHPDPSAHQGKVGERLTRKVTLTRTIQYTTKSFSQPWKHDVHLIFLFTDTDGNVYKWDTTTLPMVDDDTYLHHKEGIALTIKGTVKEHTEYDGVKQTVLNRVTFTA